MALMLIKKKDNTGGNAVPGKGDTASTGSVAYNPNAPSVAANNNNVEGDKAAVTFALDAMHSDGSVVMPTASSGATLGMDAVSPVDPNKEPSCKVKALPGVVDTDPCGVDLMDADEVTEDAVAESFVGGNCKGIRYDHDRKGWFVWTGPRWKEDKTGQVLDRVRRHARECRKGNRAMATQRAVHGVEMFARNDDRVAVESSIWDTNSMLLGTPGGTVDLMSGELIDANPGDYITRSTIVAPAPVGTACPTFKKFLKEVTQGDEDLERLLQQQCGYSLTAETSEQKVFFVHGPGGNGKSLLLTTIVDIMGDYAQIAARETFGASQHPRHLTEIAMLEGARLIGVSETKNGQPWNQERINQFTGGDRVTANRMRQDMRSFKPVGKLFFVGNHKPTLQAVNEAVKRRFVIVPFNFKPTKVDHHLPANLKKEYPAILRWLIDGCLDWLQNGLVLPEVVKKATAAYFDDEDLFGRWIEERCDRAPTLKAKAAILYGSWSGYALANGVKPGPSQAFAENLTSCGVEKIKSSSVVYLGIGLKPVSTSQFGADDM